MIEELDKLGYNNQVYVPTYNKNLAVIVPNENVIVSECFKKWDRILFDYKQRKIYKDIQSKCNISKFDCIHAYTLFTDGNCARKLSKKYGANDIRPGLSGWAQINGRDELEIPIKASLDGEYVEKMTFIMDIKCIWGTVVSVFKQEGVVEGGTGEMKKKEEAIKETIKETETEVITK
jgi:hypothetical protein